MGQPPDTDALAARLGLEIVRLTREALRAGALSPRETEVLDRLEREGPMTPAELADVQQVRRQSMTRTLAALRSRGLVDREAHETDGRKALVTLTDQGGRALAQERRAAAAWLSTAISRGLDAVEQRRLGNMVELLERLRRD